MNSLAESGGFLEAALQRGEFISTAELVLGRDHNVVDAETFVREAAATTDGIKVISVTDLPGGNPALPPEAFASFILEHHLVPIAHLSGKDGNRAFLESRLHALARMGVSNILALTGDAQKEGFSGKAKPVYDLDSVLILWLLQALRGGLEYNVGTRMARTTPFGFFAGAVVNPYKTREPDQMMQFYKLALKIATGARFIITQLGFNLRKLYELKQYMEREGLARTPVLANVYVPTAKVAQMMQSGELAGCVVTDELVRRLETEKKLQRLERAALMVAAAKDLGFAGAHIGGFGLTHKDFMTILERAAAIGGDWKGRVEELVFQSPGQFHLFPAGKDGLSAGEGEYQLTTEKPTPSWKQWLSSQIHDHFIKKGTLGERWLAPHLKPEGENSGQGGVHDGFWYKLLQPATLYREATLGCVSCGDCIQEHVNYAGCTMRWCYKELRNGPCGGSRVDGSCEAHPELPCIWNLVYLATLAVGDDPRKFARTLIPPRDWCLDKTNALANRFAGLDNLCKRQVLEAGAEKAAEGGKN
jgi:methylenetetrahydrofolate reductase (NADPH)